jgi:transposase
MMGSKQRQFVPLINVSLEELVPADHFYRLLERTLDLSFVREYVQKAYACKGRPSIDPIVFFKLQLVLFFEGIRVSTATHAACCRSAQRSLVCWLRSE